MKKFKKDGTVSIKNKTSSVAEPIGRPDLKVIISCIALVEKDFSVSTDNIPNS